MDYKAKLVSLTFAAAFTAIFTAQSPTATAQTIGINFGATTGTKSMTATDQPGVIAGANWNNFSASSGSLLSLIDSTGSASTAKLTFNSAGVYPGPAITNTSNAATNKMYSGCLVGDNVVSEISISVTNIPFALYDVYVYSTLDFGQPGDEISISDGTTTYYSAGGSGPSLPTSLLQTISTSIGSPTVGDGQYQIFSDKSSSSVTINTGLSQHNNYSSDVYGIQIVSKSASVPEPGSLALAFGGLTMGGFIALRRHKTNVNRTR